MSVYVILAVREGDSQAQPQTLSAFFTLFEPLNPKP